MSSAVAAEQTTLRRMREAIRQAESGEIGPELEWLMLCVRRYVHARRFGHTFEACLGLNDRWWSAFELKHRDAQIRELADQHFGDLGLTKQSEALAISLQRYAASSWRDDRDRGAVPEDCTGLRKAMFQVLQAAERTHRKLPTASRHFRRILRART